MLRLYNSPLGVSALHFCDKTAQSDVFCHPVAAYLGMLKPYQRTHFPFPLPENASGRGFVCVSLCVCVCVCVHGEIISRDIFSTFFS